MKLLRQGLGQQVIALNLGTHKSTLSREITRHSQPGIYWADLAQASYRQARRKCHPKEKLGNNVLMADVTRKIHQGWSPEEISGRLI